MQFTAADAVDAYLALAIVVQPHDIPPTSPDPNDDLVLGTALAVKADLIVSGDQHLLSLKAFRGIPILNSAAAVAHLLSA